MTGRVAHDVSRPVSTLQIKAEAERAVSPLWYKQISIPNVFIAFLVPGWSSTVQPCTTSLPRCTNEPCGHLRVGVGRYEPTLEARGA